MPEPPTALPGQTWKHLSTGHQITVRSTDRTFAYWQETAAGGKIAYKKVKLRVLEVDWVLEHDPYKKRVRAHEWRDQMIAERED